MRKIHVFLFADRTKPGVLALLDEGGADACWPCLGKADNARAVLAGNDGRDPAYPYGDTPTGGYRATRLVRFATTHPRLGAAWFPIEGESGQAVEARIKGGRTGLGIHAGRGDDKLVPTYGCVRMRQTDFDRLAALVDGEWLKVAVSELPA